MNFKQEYFEEDDECVNQKEREKPIGMFIIHMMTQIFNNCLVVMPRM